MVDRTVEQMSTTVDDLAATVPIGRMGSEEEMHSLLSFFALMLPVTSLDKPWSLIVNSLHTETEVIVS